MLKELNSFLVTIHEILGVSYVNIKIILGSIDLNLFDNFGIMFFQLIADCIISILTSDKTLSKRYLKKIFFVRAVLERSLIMI